MRTTRLNIVLMGVLLAAVGACGDDDDAAPASNTPLPQGGTDPSAPALKASDCPGTPVIGGLVKSSPVWGGIVVLRLQVPGGIPESIETQVFDPAANAWGAASGGGGDRRQENDGTYLIAVSVRPVQGSEDKPYKIRARAALQGCPRTAWVESEAFTLTNPLVDTTWVSETPVTNAANQNIQINPRGATKALGPYSFAAGTTISHSFTFAKDGTTSETFKFSIASKTAGDAYAGCAFQLSYSGTWQIKLLGNRMTLNIDERTPKANATEGSTCASPTIAQLDITKTPTSFRLGASNNDLSFGIDYTSAAFAPGQPIVWNYSAPFHIQNALGNVSNGLAFTEAADGATAFISLNGNIEPYIKK